MCSKKISFDGIPNSRNVLLLQFFSTFSGPRWTSLGFAPWLPGTISGTFSGTFSRTLLNLTCLCTKASRILLQNLLRNPVEPDLALHQSLPGLLRNHTPEPCWTWPGSAPKPTFSGTFSGTPWPKPPRPSTNLLRNPVEPDLALHQSLLDLLRNLLRNPVEPHLAQHQTLL